MNGVLVVDKPEGLTSFDVVEAVRRRLRVKKAGHTGTLDPMATGVLPVCLGEATKLVSFLTEGDKTYETRLRLGAATDTQDRTGKVIAEAPVEGLDRARIEEVLGRFRGPLRQVPPMYSAVRVDGKRLYELAREGKEVEREAREVTIHSLELLEVALPELTLRVRCSKGTYVRTLGHDLGEALGCHAHLTALRRTASCGFTLEQAVPLASVEPKAAEQLEFRLVGFQQALAFLPAGTLDETQARRVVQGQRLPARDVVGAGELAEGTRVRLGSADGRLVAVAEVKEGALHYQRVFVPAAL